MEDSSVKPLLATTNTILIVIAVLFGLNLAADVCGWKSSTSVQVNHSGNLMLTEPFGGWDVKIDLEDYDARAIGGR